MFDEECTKVCCVVINGSSDSDRISDDQCTEVLSCIDRGTVVVYMIINIQGSVAGNYYIDSGTWKTEKPHIQKIR